MEAAEKKTIYTIVERKDGKSYWVRIGTGFVNRDGSVTVKLDAIPVNGVLQVRDWEAPEVRAEARKRAEQNAAQRAVA